MGGAVGISLHSSFSVNVEVLKCYGLLDRGCSLLSDGVSIARGEAVM